MMASDSSSPAGTIAELRTRIEEIDRAIVRLIAVRTRLARDTGAAKRAAGLPTVDSERERAVLDRVEEIARGEGIAAADVRRLYALIIELSRLAQDAPPA